MDATLTHSRKPVSLPFHLALPLLLLACGGNEAIEEITDSRIVEDQPLRLGATSLERFGYRRPQPKPLSWERPKAWKELPQSQYLLASFQLPDDARCTLSVLPGKAGGVLANVNRWCQQLELAEVGDKEVADMARLQVLGKEAILVELGTSPKGQNLLGLICPLEDRCIFVKMVGSAEIISAEKSNFIAFCQSLKH